MKIVVLGGAGFLGSHIADVLMEKGHEVTIFDIRPSPYLKTEQKMVLGDISNPDQVAAVIRGKEVVYHLAGIADIDECLKKPIETVRYNILGTVAALEAAKNIRVSRFVFASSSYVYSNAGFFYKDSKQACESYIESYHTLYGLPFTIVRYGSLYGERADERNSLYRLVQEALTSGKLTYHGTGEELREYIHVRDAAESSVQILDKEFENQSIILTGVEKMRYRDILEMIREILGNGIRVEILPNVRKAHYQITPYSFNPRLGKKLASNPYIDMGQGLLQCVKEIYASLHSTSE